MPSHANALRTRVHDRGGNCRRCAPVLFVKYIQACVATTALFLLSAFFSHSSSLSFPSSFPLAAIFADAAGASPASVDKNAPPPAPNQPKHPIIAIVANPMEECTAGGKRVPPAGYEATGCVTDLYLRWLQGQGIRMVPMNIYWSDARKKKMLDRVNGVLLPGGGLDGKDREDYTRAASFIYEYSLKRKGFLMWGTCQGMQVMAMLAFKKDFSLLECDYKGMVPSMLPLDFTQYQPKSVMFGREAEQKGIVDIAENTNSTMNWHECGIQPHHFHPTKGRDRVGRPKVIATNVDVHGKPFVSAFEVIDPIRHHHDDDEDEMQRSQRRKRSSDGATPPMTNIFAVQFHPERPQYQFTHDIITHDRGTIDLSIYLARFIYDRMQLNDHSFESQTEVNEILLETFPHVVTGWGLGYYWINI